MPPSLLLGLWLGIFLLLRGDLPASAAASLERDLLPVPRFTPRTPTATFPRESRGDFCSGRMFTFPSRLFLTFKQKCFLS